MFASWWTGLRSRLQPGCLHVGHCDVLMPLPSILRMTHLLHSSQLSVGMHARHQDAVACTWLISTGPVLVSAITIAAWLEMSPNNQHAGRSV